MIRYSLHLNKKPRPCDVCGNEIPARQAPDYAEYWRVKGGPVGIPRMVCCMCHFMLGMGTDGWVTHADGREIMAAAVPQKQTSDACMASS